MGTCESGHANVRTRVCLWREIDARVGYTWAGSLFTRKGEREEDRGGDLSVRSIARPRPLTNGPTVLTVNISK